MPMRRLALAAALLLAPGLVSAQAFDPPSGYFTGVTRSWTLDACGIGPVAYDPATFQYITDTAVCVTGLATIGQVASGRYDVWMNLQSTLAPPAAAHGTTYAPTILGDSYAFFRYCAGSTCTTGDRLTPRMYNGSTGIGISGFADSYSALPTFDFAQFDLLRVRYMQRGTIRGDPMPYDATLTVTLIPVATPEPTTLALTLGGLAILGGMIIKRQGTA